MEDATAEDVAELATVLAEDHYLEQQLRDDVREVLIEAAYSADNNESVNPEGIELSPEQESDLVEAAMMGAIEGLESLDASDL